MNKNLFTIILSISSFGFCYSHNSQKISSSDLQKLQQEYQDSGVYENNKKAGLWIEYTIDNSTANQEITFSFESGSETVELESTIEKNKGQYVDGRKQGQWTKYSKSDNNPFEIVEITNYLNGRKHGENMYFSFGDTVLYQNYQNDTLHGLIKIFTLNFTRTIQQIQIADKGEIKLLKAFFENGRIQAEFKDTLINEIKSEYFEEFYENGILKRIESFTVQEEKPNGVFKDFYENGNTESIATYNNGTQVQEFLFYHPNGQLFTKRLYNKGKLMELLESYDSQGTPRESGTLKNGNGSLILYNDGGTPSDTLIYSNGAIK